MMPPKKASLEELVTALSDKLDSLSTQLSTQQTEHFDEMKKLVKGLKDENIKLKTTVDTLQEENQTLKSKLLNMEQHSRRNNLRVFNFEVDGDARDCEALGDQVYERALLPILQGAVAKGRLREVPTRSRLICSTHLLPGKEGKPSPIICRLIKNFFRTVILQCRKEFAPRGIASVPGRNPPYRYPIFEDVATELFRFSQQLAASDGVDAAWIAGGVIRYRRSGSDAIHKVKSIFTPIEELLA